jgi:uncharacterized repeat protein (TIGR01451 family)
MRAVIAALWIIAASTPAVAADSPQQGKLEIQTIAEKEIRIEKPGGKVELVRVPAGKVVPGDDVLYTVRVTNVSKEPVADVVITDPVPKHMSYRDGTATGTNTQVTFSVDGGATYAVPGELEVAEADGTLRPATASDYTHIRWKLVDQLHPGQSRLVRFRAKLQ